MQNYHLIRVKYFGPTDAMGARVQLYSPRFEERKVLPYDYSASHIVDMAETYLLKKNFKLVGKGEGKDCYWVISETFESIK